AILLFLPIGFLGIPAFGFGRGRASLFLPQSEINTATTSLQSLGAPPTWAPTTWAAHLLLGDEAAGLSLVLLVLIGFAVFAAAQLAFEGLFAAGWERVRFSGPRRRGSLFRFGRRPPNGPPARQLVG